MSRKKSSRAPVVCLFGPTAVGKTDLLYRYFSDGYQVINADSMQVYTSCDIGSAKPTQEILTRIEHHLIDIVHPSCQYTVGQFVGDALQAIELIQQRGKRVVVSGGTAYYIQHLLYGLPESPKADPEVRLQLERELAECGKQALYQELERIDPPSAQTIHPNDTYRVLRALEIYRSSGNPRSSFRQKAVKPQIPYLCIGLMREEKELHARIARRVELMFEQGLEDELCRLLAMGATESWPAMKGIGYSEFFSWFRGAPWSRADLKNQIVLHSRQYAKRQRTFFSRLPDVHWVHPEDTATLERLLRCPSCE